MQNLKNKDFFGFIKDWGFLIIFFYLIVVYYSQSVPK